jgi:hypothetical protein
MSPREFIIWFRGFVQASNPYNITPKQWEDICDKLNSVDLKQDEIKLHNYNIERSNYSINTTNDKITLHD